VLDAGLLGVEADHVLVAAVRNAVHERVEDLSGGARWLGHGTPSSVWVPGPEGPTYYPEWRLRSEDTE
jgi:hypothetical protein